MRLDSEQLSSRLGGIVGDEAPLVLRGGAQETPLLSQYERPEPRHSIGFRPPSADQIVNSPSGSPRNFSARVAYQRRCGTGCLDTEGPRQPARTNAAIRPRTIHLPRTPRRRTGFLVAALVLVVLALGAGVAWKLGAFSKSHTVPTLTGLTLKQATAAVKSDGFILERERRGVEQRGQG